MARYKDTLCRVCRMSGRKLYLGGDRCYKLKCRMLKRLLSSYQGNVAKPRKRAKLQH